MRSPIKIDETSRKKSRQLLRGSINEIETVSGQKTNLKNKRCHRTIYGRKPCRDCGEQIRGRLLRGDLGGLASTDWCFAQRCLQWARRLLSRRTRLSI